MTNITIMRQVDSLPPLPQTIFEIENFKKNKGSDVGELINIIEKDPLIVSTLLKVSNSAMFGFVSKIETPSRAVNLLGVNFTLSIALASNMSKAINTDLVAYGKSSDDFLRLANMQSNFLNLWLGKVDRNLRDALILPVFLQESGKFLISDAIKSQKKEKEFLKEIESRYDEIHNVEKEFVGTTTSEVTSAVFKHWGLDENLVNDIKYADEPNLASVKSKEYSQILHIVKLVCNIVKPFDEVCIEKAKKLVVEFGYSIKPFEDAISKLEDRLLDAKDE
jgi:HD-like signal output (HDOD) protein